MLLITVLLSQKTFADSPITSTDISKAYQNVEIVRYASQTQGKLDAILMGYLVNNRNPIGVKMAIINQLSWDIDGRNNAEIFKQFLIKQQNIAELMERADILICYAYLKAMDNYFDVSEALKYAKLAESKNNKSYTIAIIRALIEAQQEMDNSWCKVYSLVNNVRVNKPNNDLKEEAVNIIFEYIDGYKKYCQ